MQVSVLGGLALFCRGDGVLVGVAGGPSGVAAHLVKVTQRRTDISHSALMAADRRLSSKLPSFDDLEDVGVLGGAW